MHNRLHINTMVVMMGMLVHVQCTSMCDDDVVKKLPSKVMLFLLLVISVLSVVKVVIS